MTDWLIRAFWALLGGLLSNQIEAWLPALAKWLVRRAAARMPHSTERYEEEWLSLLEETPGGLAKLLRSLGLLSVPISARIEFLKGMPRGHIARDIGALLALAVAVAALAPYSLEPSRYAAYSALVIVFGALALGLSPSLQRLVAIAYERMGYASRITVGGLMIPLVVVLALAVSWIPASRRGKHPLPSSEPSAARKTVVVEVGVDAILDPPLAAPLDLMEHSESSDDAVDTGRDASQAEASTFVQTPPIEDANGSAAAATSRVPQDEEVASRTLSETSTLATPEQPLPSSQTEVPPATTSFVPSNVRIVQSEQ
jgi:hypothetical protein